MQQFWGLILKGNQRKRPTAEGNQTEVLKGCWQIHVFNFWELFQERSVKNMKTKLALSALGLKITFLPWLLKLGIRYNSL